MTSCVVKNCQLYKNKPWVKFFTIPKDPVRKKQWLELAQVPNLRPQYGCEGLCEFHFKKDDLVTYIDKRTKRQRVRLKKINSVAPCYFPWNQSFETQEFIERLNFEINSMDPFVETNKKQFLLEVCVDCLESVRNAIEGGAHRLELCGALSEGGLTPSVGLAKVVKNISPVPVFAMIRIRCGDFVYDACEMEAMLEDLRQLKEVKVDGFVFGALNNSNEIDVEFCRKVVELAQPLPVTFHRAFDQVANPKKTIDILSELGFCRILTSGQKDSAEKGLDLIQELVEYAKEKNIIVMPGAGISKTNIGVVAKRSGALEFHASCKKTIEIENKNNVSVGKVEEKCITDTLSVAAIVNTLKLL